MRCIYSIILSFIFFLPIANQAQIFSGTVTDEDGIPLSGANVYFDGSVYGKITDFDGKFTIEIPEYSNPKLIISYLGFQKKIINDFSKNNQIIVLKQSEVYLEEVVLVASTSQRKRLLKVFRDYFLGNNKYGKNCAIENENDIEIWYEKKRKTVFARAKKPIIIKNKLLNYKITYELETFEAYFNYSSFNINSYQGSFFIGTSFFEEMEGTDSKHKNMRNVAFVGSVQHLFWSVINDPKHEYSIAVNESELSVKEFFEITPIEDSEKYFINFKNPKFNLIEEQNEEGIIESYISYPLQVNFKRNIVNVVEFRAQYIEVFPSGYYHPIESIVLFGNMSEFKIGNLLPVNYEFSR